MVGQLLLKEWEMPPARKSATLIAIIFGMAACVAAGVSAVGWPIGSPATAAERDGVGDHAAVQLGADATGNQNRQRSATAALTGARALIAAGYERAPALLIALCAFFVLPVVALVSWLIQRMIGRRRGWAAIRAAELRAADAEPVGDLPASGERPVWSEEAWLTVDGPGPRTLPLDSRLIRIGRDQDNDVRVPDASVHRYHAVIERTPEAAFVIVDISGENGNGILINGARQSRARLCDGDVIKLGRTCLKFESPSP
jgi:hypothetical protein